MAVNCQNCADTGHVCENHPDRPWGGLCCVVGAEGGTVCEHGACGCGAGDPCPSCCPQVPQDGTGRIADAFTPSRLLMPGEAGPEIVRPWMPPEVIAWP